MCIRDSKWQEGQSFAASGKADNGLHARRTELPEAFHEKTRAWFDDITGKLVADGSIRRLVYRGGNRLCPPDATDAVPKPAPEANDESVSTEAEYAEEVTA